MNRFKQDIDNNITIKERNAKFHEDYGYCRNITECKRLERWRDPGQLSIFPTWKELHCIVFKVFNKQVEDHLM